MCRKELSKMQMQSSIMTPPCRRRRRTRVCNRFCSFLGPYINSCSIMAPPLPPPPPPPPPRQRSVHGQSNRLLLLACWREPCWREPFGAARRNRRDIADDGAPKSRNRLWMLKKSAEKPEYATVWSGLAKPSAGEPTPNRLFCASPRTSSPSRPRHGPRRRRRRRRRRGGLAREGGEGGRGGGWRRRVQEGSER